MDRVPEYGVCRLIQSHVTTALRTATFAINSGLAIESSDDGDYESKLMEQIQKPLLAIVGFSGMGREGQGKWRVALEIRIQEHVRMNRSGIASEWTALRLCEAIIATLHNAQMAEAPFAFLQVADDAISMESEKPYLVMTVRMSARLGASVVF